MSKLGIVIPLYNGSGFIKDVLTDLQNQTCKDFTCYIIDDGSTDNPEKEIKPFLEDFRFKYTKIPHSGVSVARNKGIELVEEDYIYFCDVDDSLSPFLIERCMNILDQYPETPLLTFGFCIQNPKGEIDCVIRGKEEGIYSSIVNSSVAWALWNRIFKKDFILKHSLKFEEDIDYGEDFMYINEVYYYLRQDHSFYIEIPDVLYHYQSKNFHSAVTKCTSSKEIFYEKRAKFMNKLKNFIQTHPRNEISRRIEDAINRPNSYEDSLAQQLR